jgi:two-component system, CitB family, response regulator DctR
MIKVLIVEDDPMVAQLNSRYVQSVEGFTLVGAARDGEEALEMIKNLKPQLIILDIYMPKVNGLKLLKNIRSEGISVDAILVTAAKDAQCIDEVLKWGAVDYLVKPFEFQRFKMALDGYRDRILTLSAKEEISQKDIDSITVHRVTNDRYIDHSRGIYKRTMTRIKIYLQEEHAAKSAVDVSKDLGVSRVTARRYLEYLADIGEVDVEINYGTVGRPQHLYRFKA